MAPAVREPVLGYHPCSTGFLTCGRNPAGGQCLVGSLTGAGHRGAKPLRRCELLGVISLLSPG